MGTATAIAGPKNEFFDAVGRCGCVFPLFKSWIRLDNYGEGDGMKFKDVQEVETTTKDETARKTLLQRTG